MLDYMMEEAGEGSGLRHGERGSPLETERNGKGPVKSRSASLAEVPKIKAKAWVHKKSSKAKEKAAKQRP